MTTAATRSSAKSTRERIVVDLDPAEADAVPGEEPPRLGRAGSRRAAEQIDEPGGWLQAEDAAAGATSKLNIIPLSWCSAMWQCAIQWPGLSMSSRMSTTSPVRTRTVSFQT